MPFKKKNRKGSYRPYWYVRLKTLPGYGDTGTLSTRTRSKARAREMEALLRSIAERGWYDLLDALKAGQTTLPDLLRAKHERRLGALRKMLHDPPLKEVALAYRERESYRRSRDGLGHLVRLAPAGARLSWLADPRNAADLCRRLIREGRKPNSVRASLYTAISKLLQHEYGKGQATLIMAEVSCPAVDDAREVWLTAAEIERVLALCDVQFRRFIGFLVTTGVDRGPALRLCVRDIDFARGTATIKDTKTKARYRTIDLSEAALRYVSAACGQKDESESVFELTRHMVEKRWAVVRKQAKLPHVRIKDLRHSFAVHYVRAGGSLPALAERMGLTRQTTVMRYAKYSPAGQALDVDAAAEGMGLKAAVKKAV